MKFLICHRKRKIVQFNAIIITKMNKNLHQNHRPFNFQSKPVKSILNLFQKSFNIISLSISSQGSNGVIFIQTDRGSVVLKSSNQGPRDEFLNRLASILNLSVPQSICFTCSDKEFDVIMFKIEKFCQKDEILYARIKTKLDFPFYQIIQYIPSISHAEIGPERYRKLMIQQHKLHMLGMCLGFDLIINNSDRFKLVWASDGNLSNVLIKVQSHDDFSLKEIRDRENVSINLGNYVFIDHQGNLLDLTNPHATNNFQQYLALITNFYVQLIRYLGEETQPPQPFNSLRKQIQLYSQYFLTDMQIKSIGKGIIYITNQFIRLFETQKIQALYNSLIKVVQGNSKQKNQQTNIYWNSYWNNELEKVKISYLNEMYTKISAIFTTYPQTIHQTLQETKKINAVIIQNSTPTIQTPTKSVQDQNSKQSIQQRSENEIMMNNSKQNLSEKREPITEIQKSNIQEKRITNDFQRADVIKQQQQIDIDTKLSQSKVAKDRKWRDKLKLFSSINANQH